MKKIHFLLSGIILVINFSVNAQAFQWVKRWGQSVGNPSMVGWDTEPDKFGNVYMVQRIEGTQDLDYGPGVAMAGTVGVQSTAIMRYSATGTYKWGFELPNTIQYLLKIEPDAKGNIYVAGRYGGSSDFDPSASTAILTTTTTNAFVAKYDSNMVFKWVKDFRIIGGSGTPYISFNDLLLSPAGDRVYIGFQWRGIVDLDPSPTVTVSALSNASNVDAAVIQLDSAGNYMWSKLCQGIDYEEITDMSVDKVNNRLLVTGVYGGNTNVFGTSLISASNSKDVFFSSLNTSNGNANFSKGFGSTGTDIPYAVEATTGGEFMIAGQYSLTVDFNPSAAVNALTSYSLTDPFLARYDMNGNFIWVKAFNGSGSDLWYDMDLDNNRNIWLTGQTNSCVDIDPGPGNNFQCSGGVDLSSTIMVKMDSVANLISGFDITGSTGTWSTTGVRPFAVNCSPLDNSVYISGQFMGNNIDFDPSASTAYITSVAPAGIYNTDSFFAKYLACASTPVQPGTISGSTNVCQTSNSIYSISPVANATSYLWSLPGGWTGSSTTTSISATVGATSGNMSVYAVNQCGTSLVKTLSVTVSPVPSQPTSIAGPIGICPSSSGNYSVALVAGATSYTWTLPSGWTGTSSTNSILVTSGASGGTILVTASNVCGSSPAQTLNVIVNPPPTVTASAASNTVCTGSGTTLNAGGATTYTWQPGNIVGSSIAVSPVSNTIYTVTGTSGGCNNTAQVSLTVIALPSVTISAGNGSVCIGNTTTLTASGANTYTWNTTATTTSISVSPVVNTSYTVTATSAVGCTNTAVKTISVNALPTVNINGAASPICNNQTVTLIGTGATTYTWSTSSTNVNINVSPSVTTNYTVTGTDANGCMNSAVKGVTVNPSPTVTANASSNVICNGSNTTLNATGATTYTWQPGNLSGSSVLVSPTSNTTYTVTGTNGCTNSAVVSVTVNPLPIVTITANPVTICAGGSSTITATTASPLSYTWSTNANTSNITTSVSGVYSATITDVNGCKGSSSFTLGTSSSLSLTASSSLPSFCYGNTATLTVSGATSYTWNTNATGNSIVVSPTATTTYTVLGSNSPCTGTTAISIVVNPNPTLTTVSNSTILCVGQTATLTANGANTYTWNTSANGSQIAVTPTVTTTYTVTGTDNNGCTNTSAITQSVSNCTGINQIAVSDPQINIYPNPTSGLITIFCVSCMDSEIEIYNSIGSLIFRSNLKNGRGQVDLSGYAKGIYFVKVDVITKKIIIEN